MTVQDVNEVDMMTMNDHSCDEDQDHHCYYRYR